MHTYKLQQALRIVKIMFAKRTANFGNVEESGICERTENYADNQSKMTMRNYYIKMIRGPSPLEIAFL